MSRYGRLTVPKRTVSRLYYRTISRYDYSMENKTFTFSFCQEDWELITNALRMRYLALREDSIKVGQDSVYGAAVMDLAYQHQALADDISFKLP